MWCGRCVPAYAGVRLGLRRHIGIGTIRYQGGDPHGTRHLAGQVIALSRFSPSARLALANPGRGVSILKTARVAP